MNLSCFLSVAALRTPRNPWDMRFPLCIGDMWDRTIFSSICALPSPSSAEASTCLFDRFTGTTAQSDFSCTCTPTVRFWASPTGLDLTTKTYRRSAGSRACCFSGCAGSNDYVGPNKHSQITRLSCCRPPLQNGVSILNIGFSKLNSRRRFRSYPETRHMGVTRDDVTRSVRALSM